MSPVVFVWYTAKKKKKFFNHVNIKEYLNFERDSLCIYYFIYYLVQHVVIEFELSWKFREPQD